MLCDLLFKFFHYNFNSLKMKNKPIDKYCTLYSYLSSKLTFYKPSVNIPADNTLTSDRC